MKIGITIPGYYKQYLDKIANLNASNPTKVCSLIVENFLSYNLKQKKFPLFRKDVRIVFANEKVDKGNSDINSDNSDLCHPGEDSEQPVLSRDVLLAFFKDVPEDPEDSGLPFEYDSED